MESMLNTIIDILSTHETTTGFADKHFYFNSLIRPRFSKNNSQWAINLWSHSPSFPGTKLNNSISSNLIQTSFVKAVF